MSFTNIVLSNIVPGSSAFLAFDSTNGFRIFKQVIDGNVSYLHDITADPPAGSTRELTTKAIVDGSLVIDLNNSNAFDGFEEPGQIIKIDNSWFNVNTHIDDNNVTVDRNLSYNSVVTFSGSTITTQAVNKFVNGNKVTFTTTGSIPSQITVDGVYYVVNATTTSFGISLTPGGAAISFTGTVAGLVKAFLVHNVYTTTYLPNQLRDSLLGIITNNSGTYVLEPFYSVNDSNVTPIGIVTTLPTVGEYEGQVLINSTDNNIYTWNGVSWVTTTANTSRTVSLTTTAQAFSYSSNGDTPDPSSATLTATAFNTEGTVYYEFFVDGVSVQNSATNTYVYTPRANIDDMPDVIEVKIREGSTITPILATDQVSCFGVAPGSDAITILISNEAHTLPSDSDGSNPDFTGSGTTIRVYRGNQLVPYSATLASDPSFKVSIFSVENITAGGITGSGTTATVAPISAMTANRGSIVFDVTVLVEGSETVYQKVQSFAKALEGVPGAGGSDAKTVQLTANDYSITYDTTNANPSPANFTLTAVSQNIATPYYTFRESSSTGTIIQASSTDADVIITSPAASFTPAKTYWVGVAESSGGTIIAYDTISVFSVRQSLDGENAYTVIVSNEAHTVPASSTGSVSTYSGSGTIIECFLGDTELNSVSGTPTTGQFSVSAVGTDITPGAITVTGNPAVVADHSGMNASLDVAKITYTINLENKITIEKVQSITKSKAGAAGSLGTGAAAVKLDTPNFVITYAADGTTPSPSGSINLTATAQNITDPWFKFTATPTIGGFDEGSYTDGTGNSDTKSFTIPSTYFSTPYKFRVDVSDGNQTGLAFDTINIFAVRPGLNAITAFLTNEAHTIPTLSDGTGASYAGAGGTFKVYNGSTDVTTSSIFAIDGGTDGGATWTKVQNGLTFTINETTGVYSLSGGSWTSDSEVFTATATYGGATYSKTYTVSKSKGGVASTIYYVTSSATSVKRNVDATITPATLTFSAFSVVGNANPVAYSGRFRVYRNGVLVYSSTANESSYVYTPATPSTLETVTVELYQGGGFTTLFDAETIPVVQDGSDAITVSIDNENVSFSGPASGFSGINFGTSTSTIRVYRGSTLLNYSVSGANTWSVTSQTSTGVTVAAGTGGGTTFVLPVPTAMSNINAFTDLVLTIRNAANVAVTENVRVTYTLARAGNDSTSYWMVSSVDSIKRDEANALTPANITFTGYSATGSGAPAAYAGRFRISRNGVVVYTSAGNESFYTYTPSDPSTLSTITAEMFLAGGTTTKVDEEIIPVVIDGSNAFVVSIDNENNTYPAPATGFAGITFGSATSTIRVFKGSTQLSYNTSGPNTFSCVQAATGVTVATGAASGGNSFVIPVPTAMSANTAFLDVTVTIRDAASVATTQTVRITYSLARTGVTGTNGTNNATVRLFNKNTSGVTPPTAFTGTITYTFATGGVTTDGNFQGWTTSAPSLSQGEYLWVRQATASSNTTTDTIGIGEWSAASVAGIGGTNGVDGATGPQGPTGSRARVAYIVGTSNFAFSGPQVVTKTNTTTGPASGTVIAYNFNNNNHGFTVGGAGSTLTSGASTSVLVYGSVDSNLQTPSLGLLGSVIPKITARIRCTSASPTWEGTVFFTTTDNTPHGYSSSFQKTVGTPVGFAQNVWVIVEWDMSSLTAGGSNWTSSTIGTVRFDFSNAISNWEIDWIHFGSNFVADALPASGDWGLTGTWFSYPQTLTDTGTSLYQVTGLFDGTNTVWTGYPYLSSLKVGALSAITANIGEVTAGMVRNAADTMQVDLDNGRIVFDNGVIMKVTGNGFGSTNQFLEWTGPSQAINLCTEANGFLWIKTNGDAYFGGSLSIGTLTTKAATSSLANNAETETSVYGSNGNTINVAISFTRSFNSVTYSATNLSNSSGTATFTLSLSRSLAGAAYSVVDTLTVNCPWSVTNEGFEPELGYIIVRTLGGSGSKTYVDPTLSTQTRQYKLAITSTSGVTGSGALVDTQRLGIVSTEE